MPPPIFHPLVIDVSHWIEVPDFSLLNPMPWLIITKATESNYYLDATYALYADQIREAGIRLGAYHFARPGDQVVQADFFCDFIQAVGLNGDEMLAYDLETWGITLVQVKNFLDRTQHRTGIRPIIYSTKLLLESLYLRPNIPPTWLKDEWLWIAGYFIPRSNGIPDSIVPAEISKSRIALWQYSDDGEIEGIPKNNIDLNIINQSFIEYLNLQEPNPQPPTNGDNMKAEALVTTNIRNGSLLNGVVGKLYRYDVVYGEVRSYQGLNRIFYTKVYRKDGTIQTWNEGSNSAVADRGATLLRLTNEEEPNTPPVDPPAEKTVTHTIDIFSDGSISIDDLPYP